MSSTSSFSYDNQKHLWILTDIPWGAKSFLVENHWAKEQKIQSEINETDLKVQKFSNYKFIYDKVGITRQWIRKMFMIGIVSNNFKIDLHNQISYYTLKWTLWIELTMYLISGAVVVEGNHLKSLSYIKTNISVLTQVA